MQVMAVALNLSNLYGDMASLVLGREQTLYGPPLHCEHCADNLSDFSTLLIFAQQCYQHTYNTQDKVSVHAIKKTVHVVSESLTHNKQRTTYFSTHTHTHNAVVFISPACSC